MILNTHKIMIYTREKLIENINKEWVYGQSPRVIYTLTNVDDNQIHWKRGHIKGIVSIRSFIESLEKRTYYFINNDYEIY